MNNTDFIEIGNECCFKYGKRVCGDVFLYQKIKEEGRIVAVLSDGLGSGIKANVLATLTATMALKYMAGRMNIEKAAMEIMKTLPVCKVRRISYATFTIVDIASDGKVSIIEYDNPSFILYKDNEIRTVEKNRITVPTVRKKPATLYMSQFEASVGDRIIFFSDGMNQSGMGTTNMPLGWGVDGVRDYTGNLIRSNPTVSARNLAQSLVKQATEHDAWKNGDDTTCGVFYFRKPRKLVVFTGPPVEQHSDQDIAALCRNFDGQKVICGGTTAKIISRELNRIINVDIRNISPDVPPVSFMEGIDLVTEGIITMTKTAEYLENQQSLPESTNAAYRLMSLFLENDDILFMVGTRLNDANRITGNHNIELRHSIIQRIAGILEKRFLKKVTIRYI